MSHKDRRNSSTDRQKASARLIAELILEELTDDSEKVGALLCEGDENSIDKAVYSAIFPNLVIFPLGSCCEVMRVFKRVKKILDAECYYTFAIIDRDALSKVEIKKLLRETGIYTTKLPFIENIICDANVISYVCNDLNLDYSLTIEKVREQLMKNLWQKFKEALPINLGIDTREMICTLQIGASTKVKTIEKIVNKDNILYAYRSKVIVSVVATALHMHSKSEYYAKIKEMLLDERYSAGLVKSMSNFVPRLEFYEF